MEASADHVLAGIDVERAAAGLGGRVHHTPTLSSATLSRIAGAPVFLKAELFQRTGSFKPRGVFTRLDALSPGERGAGVIGVSAGNHAAALAYASAREGIGCVVVMWRGQPGRRRRSYVSRRSEAIVSSSTRSTTFSSFQGREPSGSRSARTFPASRSSSFPSEGEAWLPESRLP
jgi:threonine dehydratase